MRVYVEVGAACGCVPGHSEGNHVLTVDKRVSIANGCISISISIFLTQHDHSIRTLKIT